MSESLRDKLRVETQSHHDAIENTINLMRIDISMAEYVAYLRAFYGYYRALELRLIAGDVSFCNSALKLDRGRKVRWLETDIIKLCGSTDFEKISICPFSPVVAKATDVVGCSYVIEGSTLGATLMYQHLHKCLGVTSNNGGSFIYGYGESTGIRWKHFIQYLEAMTFNSRQREECVEAAIATFETMQAWFTSQTRENPAPLVI